MSSDIEKITEKTKNLAIDQIYDTNWCDMPAEIKLACIGKMEFKERLSLRCTAKAERSLVDSQKIKFDLGSIIGYQYSKHCGYKCRLSLTSTNGNEFSKELSGYQTEELHLLKYIWEVGVFENLYLAVYSEPIMYELMNYSGKIAAKNVDLNQTDHVRVVPILRKMKDGVESIMLHAGHQHIDYNFDEILANSHIQNVRYWHIENLGQTGNFHDVAQMWIERNSEIGTTFQASVRYSAIEIFSYHVYNRILSKSEKRVRIRTNNPDRHILLEHGLDEIITIDSYLQFFRLMVISAEMKESEYDDNCEEWICRMAPHVYDVYDDYDDYDYN